MQQYRLLFEIGLWQQRHCWLRMVPIKVVIMLTACRAKKKEEITVKTRVLPDGKPKVKINGALPSSLEFLWRCHVYMCLRCLCAALEELSAERMVSSPCCVA